MKTASYAVMFTDIKGFTERTSRQTRAENERLLRLHDALLLPVIAGYGGRRVKTIGDAYLVVFDSATRAVACGAALQDRLALFNRRVADAEQIEVRVAINAGEVRVERDDVYGEAVNIASRVEETAEAGEVCFTEAVYLLADRTWMEVDDLGPHSLRGIPEPVRLYRLHRTPEGGMPYGGAALERLELADPDPAELARRRLSASRLWRWFAVAATAVILAAAVVALTDTGPLRRVERLAEMGRAGEAEQSMRSLPPGTLSDPEQTYLEGLIAQARGESDRAIRRFTEAAQRDPKLGRARAGDRLVALLGHDACEVRSAAAKSLASIDYEAGIEALRDLSEREPEGEGFLARIKLGGCNAGDAAREAIATLERK
ncbi:adenylate/guanylate cyclase domain-containing protein [Vulgatibacter sp.]|uniref:adenylate/guanylate cyclase domain-containing protein n=1 Tax=Vulgatibacter sp. TaxID=1971226 RepID=UPI00356851CD